MIFPKTGTHPRSGRGHAFRDHATCRRLDCARFDCPNAASPKRPAATAKGGPARSERSKRWLNVPASRRSEAARTGMSSNDESRICPGFRPVRDGLDRCRRRLGTRPI